jgi:hypothetical protein
MADSPDTDEVDNLMAWACWSVPLLLAEPLIQLRAMRRQPTRHAKLRHENVLGRQPGPGALVDPGQR